jgi:hypothetical protein
MLCEMSAYIFILEDILTSIDRKERRIAAVMMTFNARLLL